MSHFTMSFLYKGMAKLPRSEKAGKKKAGKEGLKTRHPGGRKPKSVGQKVVKKNDTSVRISKKSYSKRAIKQRSKNSVLHKAAMESARQRCADENWGATKYLDPKHPERRVADCTLTVHNT
jgi:hypothetical protein